jgi:hypothetical protein
MARGLLAQLRFPLGHQRFEPRAPVGVLARGALELGLASQSRALETLSLFLGFAERLLKRVAPGLQLPDDVLNLGERARVIVPLAGEPFLEARLAIATLGLRPRDVGIEAAFVLFGCLPRRCELAFEPGALGRLLLQAFLELRFPDGSLPEVRLGVGGPGPLGFFEGRRRLTDLLLERLTQAAGMRKAGCELCGPVAEEIGGRLRLFQLCVERAPLGAVSSSA